MGVGPNVVQDWIVEVTERETGEVIDSFPVTGTRFDVYDDLWNEYSVYAQDVRVTAKPVQIGENDG